MATSENRQLAITAKLNDLVSRPLAGVLGKLTSFGRSAASAFKGVLGTVFNLKTAVLGLAGSFLSLSAIKAFGEQADELIKLARSTGDTVENLSELTAAFALAGGKAEEMRGLLRELENEVRKAALGGTEQADAFRGLGVSIEDLQRLAPAQLFEKIAAGLDQYSTAQEKALALGRALPRQYLNLLPLLGSGLKSFQDQIREVRRVGATVTEDQAKVAEALNDAIAKVGISLGGVSRALIEQFGPEAIAVLEKLATTITENRGQVLDLAKAFGTSIVQAVDLGISALIGLAKFLDSFPGIDLIDEPKVRQEIGRIKDDLAILDEARTGSASKLKLQIQQQLDLGGDVIGYKNVRKLQKQLEDLDDQVILARKRNYVEKLGQQEQDLRSRLADLEVTLNEGIGGVLQRSREQLTRQLDATAAAVRGSSTPVTGGEAAAIVGLPTADEVARLSAELDDAVRKVQPRAAASVFTTPKQAGIGLGEGDGGPAGLGAAEQLRKNLQVLQQLASLAPDLRPLQDQLLEVQRDANVLAFQEARDSGVINADLAAAAINRLNQQLDATKRLLGGGDFFEAFGAGAEDAIRGFTDFEAAGRDAADTLVRGGLDGITNALADIVTGAKSGKEAFRSFAQAILGDLARIIARLAIVQTLNAVLGLETGGVVQSGIGEPTQVKKYSRGGVANSPQLALFGEGRQAEAFVPLPDNRSIPVTLNGAAGGQTQFVFNITAMDGRDVKRVLIEQQGTLASIWQNQVAHRVGMRQVIQRTAS